MSTKRRTVWRRKNSLSGCSSGDESSGEAGSDARDRTPDRHYRSDPDNYTPEKRKTKQTKRSRSTRDAIAIARSAQDASARAAGEKDVLTEEGKRLRALAAEKRLVRDIARLEDELSRLEARQANDSSKEEVQTALLELGEQSARARQRMIDAQIRCDTAQAEGLARLSDLKAQMAENEVKRAEAKAKLNLLTAEAPEPEAGPSEREKSVKRAMRRFAFETTQWVANSETAITEWTGLAYGYAWMLLTFFIYSVWCGDPNYTFLVGAVTGLLWTAVRSVKRHTELKQDRHSGQLWFRFFSVFGVLFLNAAIGMFVGWTAIDVDAPLGLIQGTLWGFTLCSMAGPLWFGLIVPFRREMVEGRAVRMAPFAWCVKQRYEVKKFFDAPREDERAHNMGQVDLREIDPKLAEVEYRYTVGGDDAHSTTSTLVVSMEIFCQLAGPRLLDVGSSPEAVAERIRRGVTALQAVNVSRYSVIERFGQYANVWYDTELYLYGYAMWYSHKRAEVPFYRGAV